MSTVDDDSRHIYVDLLHGPLNPSAKGDLRSARDYFGNRTDVSSRLLEDRVASSTELGSPDRALPAEPTPPHESTPDSQPTPPRRKTRGKTSKGPTSPPMTTRSRRSPPRN